MKKLILLFCIIFSGLWGYAGKPLVEISVFIENSKDGEVVAFQKTNKQGHTAFSKLGKGTYNLVVILPGKETKTGILRDKKKVNHKVAYHTKNKSYFLQNRTGNYIVSYHGLKNITGSNISPYYEEKRIKNNENKYVIGKIEVKGKQGAIAMKYETCNEKEFTKRLNRFEHDVDLILVSGKQSYSSDNKKIE